MSSARRLAAIVMVFVFLTFATLSMVQLKEMGVGLAVAVLLDATIVRALLLPATMKLLGPPQLVPAPLAPVAAAELRASPTPDDRGRAVGGGIDGRFDSVVWPRRGRAAAAR
jgi:hypothetical protein